MNQNLLYWYTVRVQACTQNIILAFSILPLDVLVGVVKCLKCDVLVGVVKCLKCDVLVGVVKCLKWSLDHTLQLKKVLHYATTMARTWLLGWLGHGC